MIGRPNSLFAQILATFGPLRNRNLRMYIGGQAVSLVGTWMQLTAQAWLVWELSKSAAALGIVGMLSHGPFFLLGPWAGVIADRYDRRKVLIVTQITAMILAATLGFLVQFHMARLWHVYLLTMMLGCSSALDTTAQQAFLGDLSGMENIRKTVLINNIMFQTSRMLGPFFAGWAISGLGMSGAFYLNSLSFLAVIYSLLRVRANQVRKIKEGSSWNQFSESLAYIRNDRRIQYLLLFTLMTTFFGFSNLQILAAHVSTVLHGDSKLLGTMMGFSGAGALVGALVIVPLTHRVRRIGRVLVSASCWTGVWFMVVSMAPSRPVALIGMFLLSMTFPVVMTNVSGLIQVLSTPDMRSRLVSSWLMLGFGAQPIAALTVGYYAEWAGTSAAIFSNGVILTLFAGAIFATQPLLRNWSLSSMDNPPGV